MDEVMSLEGKASSMMRSGSILEDTVNALSFERRAIGMKYKELTPPGLRDTIFQRNMKLYNDPYGPTVDYFRNTVGLTYDEILPKIWKFGGGDLGF